VGFWDEIIKNPLLYLLGQSTEWDRDTTRGSDTVSLTRPDFLLTFGGLLVIRGEEKEPSSSLIAARNDLFTKLEWRYPQNLPYVFGYYACGRFL
jgi:hypothetical protein